MNTKLIHTNQHLLLMSTGEHEKLLAYLPLTPNAPVLEGVPPMVPLPTNGTAYAIESKGDVNRNYIVSIISKLGYKPKSSDEFHSRVGYNTIWIEDGMWTNWTTETAISKGFKIVSGHDYVKNPTAYPLLPTIQNQFDLADIEAAFDAGRERIKHPDWDYVHESFDDYKKTLSTVTSTPVNFEPEWKDIGGEEWMGDDYSGEPFWNEVLRLKLNDAGEVCGTWKY